MIFVYKNLKIVNEKLYPHMTEVMCDGVKFFL